MKSSRPRFSRTLGAWLPPRARPGVFAAGGLALGLAFAPVAGRAGVGLVAEQKRPAPSSSLTKSEAMEIGARWKQTNPAMRSYCEVHPTGSMVPILDSRCVLLLERVSADQLRKNDISIYMRGDDVTVCHRVMDVRNGAVLFEGDNNPRSDGWVARDRILWRVTAIIFTQREGATGVPGRDSVQAAVSPGAVRATR
jgi:hypothetical protein